MEQVCKFCKHWSRSLLRKKAYGQCGNEKFEETDEEPEHTDGLIFCVNDPYCGAGIQTGENFGCIHWEMV